MWHKCFSFWHWDSDVLNTSLHSADSVGCFCGGSLLCVRWWACFIHSLSVSGPPLSLVSCSLLQCSSVAAGLEDHAGLEGLVSPKKSWHIWSRTHGPRDCKWLQDVWERDSECCAFLCRLWSVWQEPCSRGLRSSPLWSASCECEPSMTANLLNMIQRDD